MYSTLLRPVLEMLACVGEVDAERLEGAARGSIARVGVEPDQVAAEGHRDVAHRRIATDDDIVLAQVDRIVRPLLQAHEGHLGAVSDIEGEHLGVGRRSAVADHDRGASVSTDAHEEVLGQRRKVRGGGGTLRSTG